MNLKAFPIACAVGLIGCGGGSLKSAQPIPVEDPIVVSTPLPSAIKLSTEPVIVPTQAWESANIEDGSTLKVGAIYYHFYCAGSVPYNLGYATSTESDFPLKWTKYENNPIIRGSDFYSGLGLSACAPRVIPMPDGTYRMYLHSWDGIHDRGFLLTSTNFPNEWTIANDGKPIFTESLSGWDSVQIQTQSIIPDFESPDGLWHLFYFGKDDTTFRGGHATSKDGIQWTRESAPMMVPGTGWKKVHVGPLGWFKREGTYYILAQGYDGEKWTLGYYSSQDLKTFTASLVPILTPTPNTWDAAGIEGVDTFQENGKVWLFYLGSESQTIVGGGYGYRMGVAKLF
jgi:predicted GH43/DUF377 family glycosyl hydrolase